MTKVKVYNQEGKEAGEQILNPDIFGIEIKPSVIQQVVVAMQSNSRQVLAHTKDRSEVAGGGRKPWRQKGTGRARHGSIRSPLWRGGGITFGPTNQRNFSLKINNKVRRKALFMGLTDKASNQKIILLDSLELPEIKTKSFFAVLQNLKLRTKKDKPVKTQQKDKTKKESVEVKNDKIKKGEPSILLIIAKKDEKVRKSARNIDRLDVLNASSLNILDVLKHQYVVMPVGALEVIEDTFLRK